jgi:glycerol-3-phosphate acyltransferase PlsY
MTLIITITVAYALGCLNTGYYLTCRMRGEDVRQHGSGATGATNVARLLGKRGFVLTLIGDFAKGLLAVLLASWMGVEGSWLLVVTLAAIVGHVWPLQLQFKGGKGVATAAGGFMATDPPACIIGILVFTLLLYISKSQGLSGFVVALGLPIIQQILGGSAAELLVLLMIESLLIWTHRENLRNYRLKKVSG